MTGNSCSCEMSESDRINIATFQKLVALKRNFSPGSRVDAVRDFEDVAFFNKSFPQKFHCHLRIMSN